MNVATFPIDSALPQVKVASDATLMREVFRRHLRPCSGTTYDIQDCSLTRVRFRRASRCILQYNLRLLDSTTGRARNQWVTGIICPGDGAKEMRLHASSLKEEVSRAFQTFEPVSFIPKLQMVVQVFPYDRQLSSLPALVTGPPPEVESLLMAQFGPGDWRPEAWTIDPIRYRAEKAAVLKYSVQARDGATGKREERGFYLKVYGNEKGEPTYQVLQALWRKDNAKEHFTVPKPIAYLSDLHTLIQEETAGISFQQILVHGGDQEAESAARKVARALAALHLDHISAKRRRPFKDQISRLNKTGKALQAACPHLNKELEAIVGNIVAALEEVPLRQAHLDLKTDHVLLDGNRCTLLDLDSFAEADPVLDAARMLAQIVAMRFRFSVLDSRLQMAARAFEEEYFNHVPGPWRNRLRTVYAGAALKVALGFFRRQERDWPEALAALLAEAQNSLAGRFCWEDFP
jgi:hypothetical protein